MKKKTVITTEKHEVWVIREGAPKPDQPIDAFSTIEVQPAGEPPLPEDDEGESDEG